MIHCDHTSFTSIIWRRLLRSAAFWESKCSMNMWHIIVSVLFGYIISYRTTEDKCLSFQPIHWRLLERYACSCCRTFKSDWYSVPISTYNLIFWITNHQEVIWRILINLKWWRCARTFPLEMIFQASSLTNFHNISRASLIRWTKPWSEVALQLFQWAPFTIRKIFQEVMHFCHWKFIQKN